jgi:hypothetical protein
MPSPGVPGVDSESIELACGQSVSLRQLDMGLREYGCRCGETHAVVMDVHPPSRWVPEAIVGVLQETVEPSDGWDTFGTVHLMGMVFEEYPDSVDSLDTSEDGSVGYSRLWLTGFDARRLHELIIELVVELMDHAIGHSEDGSVAAEFESQMLEFDIEEFVTAYRAQRDFDDEFDRPA